MCETGELSSLLGLDPTAAAGWINPDSAPRRRCPGAEAGLSRLHRPSGPRAKCSARRRLRRAPIRAYFERFPAILAYVERIKTDCRRTGNVEASFGWKCIIAGNCSPNPTHRARAEERAIDAPLQGSAADIIKRVMALIPAIPARKRLKARMLLQVHDELLFETPDAEVDDTARVVKAVMEAACAPRCELSVPLVVETGHGRNWDEAH